MPTVQAAFTLRRACSRCRSRIAKSLGLQRNMYTFYLCSNVYYAIDLCVKVHVGSLFLQSHIITKSK